MEKTTKTFKDLLVSEKFEAIAKALEVIKADPTMIEFVQEKATQAENRRAKRKPSESKTAKEKNADADKIETWFFENADPEVFYSSQEVNEALELGYTPQKMTPRLKVLVEREVLEKGVATSDKKKVGYKVK